MSFVATSGISRLVFDHNGYFPDAAFYFQSTPLYASVAEVGVIETGTSGAHAIEAAAPMLVLVVGMVLAAGLMLLAAALLRPRLARLLASAPRLSARPSVIPGTKPDPSAAASDDAERAA